jgi:hypothetical protein
VQTEYGLHWELLPIFIRAITRQSFCLIARDRQIKDWFLAAAMKNPRVDQKALRRYRKIMAAFNLADPRHLIVRVKVPADLTAEMLDDEIGATRAAVRLLRAKTKAACVTRESGELFSQCISPFTFWTWGHPAVVATCFLAVNMPLSFLVEDNVKQGLDAQTATFRVRLFSMRPETLSRRQTAQ